MSNLAYSYEGGFDTNPVFLEILILDDSEFDRRRLRRVIRNLPVGCNCTETESIAEFKQQISQKRYDIVMIDYDLGAGDGLEALNICKCSEANNDALLVMVTGNDTSTLAVKALKSGFDDYIRKEDLSFEAMSLLVQTAQDKRLDSLFDNSFGTSHVFTSSELAQTEANTPSAGIEDILEPRIRRAIDDAVAKMNGDRFSNDVARFLSDWTDQEDFVFVEWDKTIR